jgi:hypothetical protein
VALVKTLRLNKPKAESQITWHDTDSSLKTPRSNFLALEAAVPILATHALTRSNSTGIIAHYKQQPSINCETQHMPLSPPLALPSAVAAAALSNRAGASKGCHDCCRCLCSGSLSSAVGSLACVAEHLVSLLPMDDLAAPASIRSPGSSSGRSSSERPDSRCEFADVQEVRRDIQSCSSSSPWLDALHLQPSGVP